MRRTPLSAAAILAATVCCAQAQTRTPPASANGDVAARIDGRAITTAEVDARWKTLDPAGFGRLALDQYEARRRALEDLVNDALVSRAAAARGLSKDAFLAAETTRRAKPITDAEIEQTYRGMASRFPNATLDQMRAPIRGYLEQQQRDTVVRAIVDEVKQAGATVELVLEAPRQQIAVEATDPAIGPATAEVELVEFSDFQCPYCLSVTPTLKRLREAYPDRVRLVYRDFPLTSIHPHAFQAAEGAQCAREQGRFWEYHDKLFANQKALDGPSLNRYAVELGLDAKTFAACLDQGRMKPLVEADMRAAQQYGVESTPAFFLNGRPLLGAQPFEAFRQAVQDELDRRKPAKK